MKTAESGVRPAVPCTVAGLMREEVVTVSPSDSIRKLTQTLRRHGVSGVPVVEGDRRVVGTVSVSDLMWLSEWFAEGGRANETGVAEHLDEKKVRDVMTPDVFGVGPEASLAELARFFARTGLRRAVVLDHGKLVGIVSVIDLLDLIADQSDREEC
jgi:CBS-domain-containing membrane protein